MRVIAYSGSPVPSPTAASPGWLSSSSLSPLWPFRSQLRNAPGLSVMLLYPVDQPRWQQAERLKDICQHCWRALPTS